MNVALVFVHLGHTPPIHLKRNLELTKRAFPTQPIYLAGDSNSTKQLAERLGVVYFSLAGRFEDPASSDEGLARTGFDLKFWDGYWQKTFDRILALEDIHKSIGDGSLLHVESDVILLSNFPFAELSECKTIMWPEHKSYSDIGSLIFTPTPAHTSWLTAEMRQVAIRDKTLNDMRALFEVRQKYPEQIRPFPAMPGRGVEELRGWVFDGAYFGNWLIGWDPRAHWGIKKRGRKSSIHSTNLDSAAFIYRDGSLEVSVGEQTSAIANLHIHSKELKYFDYTKNSLELERALDRARKGRLLIGFSFSAAISWFRGRISRWTGTALDTTKRVFWERQQKKKM